MPYSYWSTYRPDSYRYATRLAPPPTTSKKMLNETICPACGYTVSARGTKHRGSKTCSAQAVAQRNAKRGWVTTSINRTKLFRRTGVPYSVDALKWESRKAKDGSYRFVQACYVPMWVATIAELELPLRRRAAILKRGAQDDDFRLAVEALLLIPGEAHRLRLVVNFLKQQGLL